MNRWLLLFLLFLTLVIGACTVDDTGLVAERCKTQEDCPLGTTCVATYCLADDALIL